MPHRLFPDHAALARARAGVDVTACLGHDFSARAAAHHWQALKQARGQDADLTRLAPAHIIGQPAEDTTLSNVQAIDAARSRVSDRIRSLLRRPDLGGAA